MRRIIVFLLALGVSLPSFAEHELSYDELMLAKLAMGIPEQQWPEIAQEHLRLWQSGRWEQLQRGDEQALAEAIKAHEQLLREQAAAFDLSEPFSYSKAISIEAYDAAAGGFPMQRLFRHSVTELANNSSTSASVLPIEFLLMVANNGDFDVLPMTQKQADSFIESRMRMRKRQRNRLYAEADIQVISIFHGRQFQALIRELRIYAQQGDDKPIATLGQQSEGDQKVIDWMLAQGVTHPGTPVHQFDYAGYRMNEIVDPYLEAYGECERVADQGIHRHYLCKREHHIQRVPLDVQMDIVGGRLQEARFYRRGEWSEEDIQRVLHNLHISMKRSGSAVQWYYGPAILELNESAMQADIDEAYLKITVDPAWAREITLDFDHDSTK